MHTLAVGNDVANPVKFMTYGRSYIGGRENNEDNFIIAKIKSCSKDPDLGYPLCDPDILLLGVADGVGGLSAGEVASQIFVDTLSRDFPNMISKMQISSEEVVNSLVQAFKKANLTILDKMSKIRKRGGTTGTAVLAVGDLLHVVHAGDSRAYLITDEGIDMLTEDHSVAWRDFKSKVEPELLRVHTPDTDPKNYYKKRLEYLQNHPQAHTITNVVGYYGDIEPFRLITRIPRRISLLLLATDGLTDLLDEYEIYEATHQELDLIYDYARFGGDGREKESTIEELFCKGIVDRLIEKAKTRTPHDNITIVLACAVPCAPCLST
jgi:protein phosphatase